MGRNPECLYRKRRKQNERLQLPNLNEEELLSRLKNIVFARNLVRQPARDHLLQAVVDAVKCSISPDKLPLSIIDLRRRPLVYKNALQAKIDELHAKKPYEEPCDFQSPTQYEKILAQLVAADSRTQPIANPQKQ